MFDSWRIGAARYHERLASSTLLPRWLVGVQARSFVRANTPSSAPSPWPIAIVATLAMSVSYLDRQTLAAIAPTVMHKLNISHERFGWLASAFAFAYLAFAPISGRIVDRFGARISLGIAVLVWSLVAAAHAGASTFASLVVLRVMLGAAEAPSFPAAARTIRHVLPPAQRSAGFGLLFTGSSIGAMVAPALAVRLTRDHGFRYAFAGVAIVGLAWLPFWLFFTRKLGDAPTEQQGPAPAWEVLSHPAMRRQAIAVAASAPALMIVMTWFPQFLVEASGVSKDDVGHYVWLPPLLFDVAAVSFGLLASLRDRRNPNASHRTLMLIAASLTATLALVPLGHGPWTRVLIASVAMAGGAGMYVIGTADLMRRMTPNAIATASGISAAVQSIVQIIASPVIGAVLDRTHAWTGVLVVLGVIAIPGGALWSSLPADNRV